MHRTNTRQGSGATIIQALFMVVIVGLAAAVFMPALTASGTDTLTECLQRCQGLLQATLAYVGDQGRIPCDLRAGWLREPPQNEVELTQSWFAQLQGYVSSDPSAVDCPVSDDHRKGPFWPTDYVLNHFGINQSPDVAAEPARALLVAEPNMTRGSVEQLDEILASAGWGPRPDLEQHRAASLSFGFADGHALRLGIPQVDYPYLILYPEVYSSSPGSHDNWLWWYPEQEPPLGR